MLLSVISMLRAPLMSVGESSVMVSLYLVILLAQLWLTEPFQAACKYNNTVDIPKLQLLSHYHTHVKKKNSKAPRPIWKRASPLLVLTLGSGAGASSPSPGLVIAIRLCSSEASSNSWPGSWLPGGISVSSSWLSLHSARLGGTGLPPLLYWGVTAVESRPPDTSLFGAERRGLLPI